MRHRVSGSTSGGTVCRPCEQTARDERKRGNRWRIKAGDIIRRHADTISKTRIECGFSPITKDDLINIYGWDPDKIAHEAEYHYGNGCGYCDDKYLEMGHGFSDITLDIVDRGREPYYRTNTNWCCMTCNRKKSAMTPEEFEEDRQVYELWRQMKERGYDPLIDDPNSIFYVPR